MGVLAIVMALNLQDLLMIFHWTGSELASSRIEDSKFTMHKRTKITDTLHPKTQYKKTHLSYIFHISTF